MRSTRAITACANWLTYCLALGWPKKDLDRLQQIWWEWHDDYGRLTKERQR